MSREINDWSRFSFCSDCVSECKTLNDDGPEQKTCLLEVQRSVYNQTCSPESVRKILFSVARGHDKKPRPSAQQISFAAAQFVGLFRRD